MKSLLRYSNQQSKTQLPRKRNTYLNDRIIPSLQVRLQAQAKPAPGEKLMFTGTLDCAYKTVKNEVCEDVGRGWWGEFQSSSHHLLSPSPLTISRTVSSHCISHHPKSPPHCCRQLPLSLVHIHTLTQGLRGLYRGMLAPLLAVTPLYALGFLGYGIGKQLHRKIENLGIFKNIRVTIIQK